MAEALDVPAARNETFNIGADAPCSLNDLAHTVAAAMSVPANVIHLPPRHEVRHAHSAHEKIRAVFGARPQTSLQDGLATMAAWVRDHGARQTAPFADIEILKNLPPVWQPG
jgi:UDP-glucose 4-epimerase